MKTYLHATIPLLSLIGFFAIPAYGDVGNIPGISIRVYVPNEMRLENEIDHIYVVRIENRGNVAVPVLNTLTYWWDGRDEPIQSRVQTRKEANAGTPLPVGNWDAIMRQAQPSELHKDPSMLGPGMAIELTDSWLATPLLPDGESRIVIQIGPQQFAYSNWVNVQVLPKEDNSDWPVVAERELGKAPRDGYEYVTHEEASGIWLFARSNQKTTAFWRVCRLPNGATPMIESDWDRHQAAILFPDHPESTCYYSTLISVSRSKPWPVGGNVIDLMGKFIPVDVPSPLEFPLELFGKNHGKASTSKALNQSATRQASGRATDHSSSSDHPTLWPPVWIWIAGCCVLVATFAVKLNTTLAKR